MPSRKQGRSCWMRRLKFGAKAQKRKLQAAKDLAQYWGQQSYVMPRCEQANLHLCLSQYKWFWTSLSLQNQESKTLWDIKILSMHALILPKAWRQWNQCTCIRLYCIIQPAKNDVLLILGRLGQASCCASFLPRWVTILIQDSPKHNHTKLGCNETAKSWVWVALPARWQIRGGNWRHMPSAPPLFLFSQDISQAHRHPDTSLAQC